MGQGGRQALHFVSLAELMGFDAAAMWRLAWVLFFVRLGLGFLVGIDDVLHGFRSTRPDRAQHEREARTIRRANLLVTVLHMAILTVFALAALRVPAP